MKNFIFICLILHSVFFAGCATHTSTTAKMRASWSVGDVQNASLEAKNLAEDASSTDSLIFNLELATTLRANGEINESRKIFDKAYSQVENFENRAKINLAEESEAILTNQSYITYRGTFYDKIMLCVYQALNAIQQKDFDLASVYIKRLENFQRNARTDNARQIEKESRAILNSSENKNGALSQMYSNPQISNALKSIYGDNFKIDTRRAQASSSYVNPFAYWLAGLYYANDAYDVADKNLASDMFRLGGETLGNSSYVFAQDFKMAEDLANGKISKPNGITYIIFETGLSPILEQRKLNLPLYIVARNVPHVSVNLPYLQPQNSYSPSLNVSGVAQGVKFETLADFDKIVSRDFNDKLPVVIAKTLLSSAAKATAQYFAANAAGRDWGVLVNIAGSIYQSLLNDADLRTWTTLPKQIKVARFATPPSQKILIEGTEIRLNPNGVNVIFAKKMSANSRLFLQTFDFEKK